MAKGAAGAAAGAVVRGAREWLKGDEFTRLLEAVAAELGTDVGPLALEPLRDDDRVVELIAAVLQDDSAWDEEALVDAIEPHVGAASEVTSARDFAREIAQAIRRNAWQALKADRAAVVREVRAASHQLAQQLAPTAPRFLSDEWIPRQAVAHVRELATVSAGEAVSLEQALADELARPTVLRGLIEHPPPWVEDGTAALWVTLGELALAYALVDVASTAFVAASARPTADRAQLLSRAAQLAYAGGDDERGDELLDTARTLDGEHPGVAIAEARRLEDHQGQLDRLIGVEPRSQQQEAGIEAIRAMACLSLGDFDGAAQHCDRAIAAGGESPAVRELRPLVAFIRNYQLSQDEEVDWVQLADAARDFLELRDELQALGRHDEAKRMAARASQAYYLAGDSRRAQEVLIALDEDEVAVLDDMTARLLAAAALEAGLPDLVPRFLELASDSDFALLLRANARLMVGPEEDARGSVPDLDRLLESDEEGVRFQAAHLRMLASLLIPEVDRNSDAELLLRESDPVLAITLEAGRLDREGRRDEAERLLLEHQGDSRALEALVELAAQHEDWNRAITLYRRVLAFGATPERRLRYARLLARAGEVGQAVAELAGLRSDTTVPLDVRDEAFARSARFAWRSQQFGELVEVAQKWLETSSENRSAAWALVLGLTRLSRHAEALALIDDRRLEPRDESDAGLAASVFHRALPPNEALRRIVALSDQFDRRVEQLEALVIFAGIGLPENAIDPELRERRGLTFSDFLERFPESRFMTAVPAPTTAEEVEAFVREHFQPRSSQLADLQQQVRRGETGIPVLAAATGRQIPELWARLELLPLAYGDRSVEEVELAAARDAIGTGAVTDASALFIVGGLGEEISSIVLGALPGSVVPQAVLDDAAASTNSAATPGEEQHLLGWDPTSERPQMTIVPADLVATQQRALEGVLGLARALLAVPNVDPTRPTDFDRFFDEDDDEPAGLAFKTWPASFAAAKRLELPLYSDDRFIRAHARGAGIAAFGTPAFLRALAERGFIDHAVVDGAVLRLRASGGLGLVSDPAQLLDEIAAMEWGLSTAVMYALLDPTTWRAPGVALETFVRLLQAVRVEAPDKFEPWVARIVDAARVARPEQGLLIPAAALLATGWMARDLAFGRALTSSIRALRSTLGLREDPVPHAIELVSDTARRAPPEIGLLIVRATLRALEPSDQLAMLALIRITDQRPSGQR